MTLPTSPAATARRRLVLDRLASALLIVLLLAVVVLCMSVGEAGTFLLALPLAAVLWTVYALLVARHP